MTRKEAYIRCTKCDVTVGTVFATETFDGSGFWRNKPVPDPMPKRCKLCNSPLTREGV